MIWPHRKKKSMRGKVKKKKRVGMRPAMAFNTKIKGEKMKTTGGGKEGGIP